jgi:hypothetical protein
MKAVTPKLTEKDFLAQVVQLAKLAGWRVAHFRPARTLGGWRTSCQADAAGFPDLVLVKGRSLLFIELKVGTNPLTPEQARWLEALAAAGQDARIWRPADWPEIEDALVRGG